MVLVIGGLCVYCGRRVLVKVLRGASWEDDGVVYHATCDRAEQRLLVGLTGTSHGSAPDQMTAKEVRERIARRLLGPRA